MWTFNNIVPFVNTTQLSEFWLLSTMQQIDTISLSLLSVLCTAFFCSFLLLFLHSVSTCACSSIKLPILLLCTNLCVYYLCVYAWVYVCVCMCVYVWVWCAHILNFFTLFCKIWSCGMPCPFCPVETNDNQAIEVKLWYKQYIQIYMNIIKPLGF